MLSLMVFFFFSSRRRHTRCGRDWSSDVCSSDLPPSPGDRLQAAAGGGGAEGADDDEHHHHGGGDETEYPGGAAAPEKECDDVAREDGAEPAPGIHEADRARPDAGRVELGLI